MKNTTNNPDDPLYLSHSDVVTCIPSPTEEIQRLRQRETSLLKENADLRKVIETLKKKLEKAGEEINALFG